MWQNIWLKWRLYKDEHADDKNVKFCHYYNNSKDCHIDEVGCKFRHEESELCNFKVNCSNKLRQSQHEILKQSDETYLDESDLDATEFDET